MPEGRQRKRLRRERRTFAASVCVNLNKKMIAGVQQGFRSLKLGSECQHAVLVIGSLMSGALIWYDINTVSLFFLVN